MVRKVFIVNNQAGTKKSLTVVTTYDCGTRYVDMVEGDSVLLPTVIGSLSMDTEVTAAWIGSLEDNMFSADERGRDATDAAFWAERRYVS